MTDTLVQMIFGWPAIIMSVVLSVAGCLLRKPWLLVVGGVLAIPFSWYLSGYPAIRTPVIILPLFQFAGAWALSRGRQILAWWSLAPLGIVVALLAVVVLTQ